MNKLLQQSKPSKDLFIELCQQDQNSQEIFQILIAFPDQFICEQNFQKFIVKNKLQKEYCNFQKINKIEEGIIDPILGRIIKFNEQRFSNDSQLQLSSIIKDQAYQDIDNSYNLDPSQMNYGTFVDYLSKNPLQLQTYKQRFINEIDFAVNLPKVYKQLTSIEQNNNYSQYLNFLSLEQLQQEEDSEEQQYLLVFHKCYDKLNQFGQQLYQDFQLYQKFIKGDRLDDSIAFSLSNSQMQIYLRKLNCTNLPLFYLYLSAYNNVKSIDIDDSAVQHLKDKLNKPSTQYSDNPSFKIILQDDFNFSVETITNNQVQLKLQVYFINTQSIIEDNIVLDQLQLNNPNFELSISNDFVQQIHSFTLSPQYQSDFIFVLQLDVQRVSFYYQFKRSIIQRQLSRDMSMIQIKSQNINIQQGDIYQKFNEDLVIELYAEKLELLNIYDFNLVKINNLETFYQKVKKLEAKPDFFINLVFNPELLLSCQTIDIECLLMSKLDILNIHNLSTSIINIKGKYKTYTFIHPESNKFQIEIEKISPTIQVEVDFIFNGKQEKVRSEISIQQSQNYLYKLIRVSQNKFVLLNLINHPCANEIIDIIIENNDGKFTEKIITDHTGSFEVKDFFEFIIKINSQKFIFRNRVSTYEYEFYSQIKNFDLDIYEEKFNTVNEITDFKKNYFVLFQGQFYPIKLFKLINGFKIYQSSFVYDSNIIYSQTIGLSGIYYSQILANTYQLLNKQVSTQFISKNNWVIKQLLEINNKQCNYEDLIQLNKHVDVQLYDRQISEQCNDAGDNEDEIKQNYFVNHFNIFNNIKTHFRYGDRKYLHKYTIYDNGQLILDTQ